MAPGLSPSLDRLQRSSSPYTTTGRSGPEDGRGGESGRGSPYTSFLPVSVVTPVGPLFVHQSPSSLESVIGPVKIFVLFTPARFSSPRTIVVVDHPPLWRVIGNLCTKGSDWYIILVDLTSEFCTDDRSPDCDVLVVETSPRIVDVVVTRRVYRGHTSVQTPGTVTR